MKSKLRSVHLVAEDGGWLTAQVPLLADGSLDPDAPGPFKFEALWGNDSYTGEIDLPDPGEELAQLVWRCEGESDEESDTDFLTRRVKIREGRQFRIWSGRAANSTPYIYAVKQIFDV
jgi:hypothetical protein